eukprot:COSAG01_NODE_26283_length_718_cov_28.620355_1_plen_65_part_10
MLVPLPHFWANARHASCVVARRQEATSQAEATHRCHATACLCAGATAAAVAHSTPPAVSASFFAC